MHVKITPKIIKDINKPCPIFNKPMPTTRKYPKNTQIAKNTAALSIIAKE